MKKIAQIRVKSLFWRRLLQVVASTYIIILLLRFNTLQGDKILTFRERADMLFHTANASPYTGWVELLFRPSPIHYIDFKIRYVRICLTVSLWKSLQSLIHHISEDTLQIFPCMLSRCVTAPYLHQWHKICWFIDSPWSLLIPSSPSQFSPSLPSPIPLVWICPILFVIGCVCLLLLYRFE